MAESVPPFSKCHDGDGYGEREERGPLLRQLDALGIKYKNLHANNDGTLCLNLSGTRITDLSSLTELPLSHISLQGCYGITDFSPSRHMRPR